VIVIYNGDIYVAQRKDLEKKGIPFTKEEWQKNPERYGNLLDELQKYPLRRRMMRDHKDVLELFSKGSDCFHILRKPPDKILALLRPVYDNDHQAKDLPRSAYQRWAPESDEATPSTATDLLAYVAKRRQAEQDRATWKADQDGKSFSIERSGNEIAWLRYRNLLRPLREEEGNPRQVIPVPITDFLSYNTANTQRDQKNYRWVGDLILECEVKVEKAEGELILQLSKGADRFQARWDLATGRCTLERIKGDVKPPQSISDPTLTKLSKPGTYLVRFANVDQRLTVWVDKTLPFDQGVSYQPSRELGPTQGNDLEPASIGVRGPVSLTVQKLKLGRDTYYTQGVEHEEGLTEKEWEDPQKWDTYQRGPTSFYVQPGHYFCMGDNSPASSDSRSWDKESLSTYIGGLVPERLMLGRALAIYWPISRFGRIK
jgi:signal peptidase I